VGRQDFGKFIFCLLLNSNEFLLHICSCRDP
jgi:hypothetical protein